MADRQGGSWPYNGKWSLVFRFFCSLSDPYSKNSCLVKILYLKSGKSSSGRLDWIKKLMEAQARSDILSADTVLLRGYRGGGRSFHRSRVRGCTLKRRKMWGALRNNLDIYSPGREESRQWNDRPVFRICSAERGGSFQRSSSLPFVVLQGR